MSSQGLVRAPPFEAAEARGDGLKRRWGDKVYTRRYKKAKTITSYDDEVIGDAPPSDLGSNGLNSGKEFAGAAAVVVAVEGTQTGVEERGASLELSTNIVALQMHMTGNCVESTVADCPQLEASAPLVHDQAEKLSIAKIVSKYRLGSVRKSKQEGIDLKGKFEIDLETVRGVMRKIGIGSEAFPQSVVRLTPPVFAQRLQSMRPSDQLRVAVMGSNFGMPEVAEKRTPKANLFFRNSEFILVNDKFPSSESNKKSKSNLKKNHGSGLDFRVGSKTFKSCSALLERLLKHHFSRIFDSPVDAKGLGLHDYFNIIKQPMDLGTVRERLNSNYYKVPRDFAEDVRLTFYNAMTYNPEGHEVHAMAKVMLKIFEERWAVTETEYVRALKLAYHDDVCSPTSARSTPLAPSLLSPTGGRFLSRSQTMVNPVYRTAKAVNLTLSGRIRAPKKPKARDLNKRDMTYTEKQKLSSQLQSLPIDKIDGIIQIIKRRNPSLSLQSNEIEVDIDAVDAETLWELDRFITNQRKNLSKMKRRNEVAANSGKDVNVTVPENIVATEPVCVEAIQEAVVEGTPGKSKIDDKIVYLSKFSPPPSVANNLKSSSSSSSSSDTGSSSSNRSGSKSPQMALDSKHPPTL